MQKITHCPRNNSSQYSNCTTFPKRRIKCFQSANQIIYFRCFAFGLRSLRIIRLRRVTCLLSFWWFVDSVVFVRLLCSGCLRGLDLMSSSRCFREAIFEVWSWCHQASATLTAIHRLPREKYIRYLSVRCDRKRTPSCSVLSRCWRWTAIPCMRHILPSRKGVAQRDAFASVPLVSVCRLSSP
jgi:hypothetical protein